LFGPKGSQDEQNHTTEDVIGFYNAGAGAQVKVLEIRLHMKIANYRKLHEVNGTLKEKAGQIINSPGLEAEGQLEKTAGKVQQKVGQIEEVLGGLCRLAGITAVTLLLGVLTPALCQKPGRFVRAQAPPLLTYGELIELGSKKEVAPALASRMDKLLGTPFISNGAYLRGARPLKTRSPQLGQFTRVAFWNIARGLQLDALKLIYSDPAKFRRTVDTNDSPRYQTALQEASILREANILVINEADLGMKRTDYRDVVKELAEATRMNYAYGVEFVEVDPISLGTETFEGVAEEARSGLREAIAVDPSRYRGLHGTAILSRYPIRRAIIKRFSHEGYDWFEGEREGVSIVEQGKRQLEEKVFLEKVLRETRRGGRMMLVADLEVPDLPERTLTVVATHLENRSTPKGRRLQMEELLSAVKDRRNPVILAGDLNTSGADQTPTSIKREIAQRLGSRQFWASQGLKYATGVGLLLDAAVAGTGFIRKHTDPTVRHLFLVAPNREEGLFDLLEEMRFADGFAFDFRGDRLQSTNQESGTLANSNQRDSRGFSSTYEVERTISMAGKFKLDWIFVKSFLSDPKDKKGTYRFAPHFGRTLSALNECVGERISDHDPISVDLPFGEPELAEPVKPVGPAAVSHAADNN